MNFNINGIDEVSYDAIVVGSGISGGWAAKELSEKGLKTLVLDRGRDYRHVTDYDTTTKAPWELKYREAVSNAVKAKNPVQIRTGYTKNEGHGNSFVNDDEHPFLEDRRFDWIRSYQKGGRSILWGRQSYRHGPLDFEANAKEGIATPWPVSYDDIKPWYEYVEKFAGISGQALGLPQLPDSIFQPPFELNAAELHVKRAIDTKWKDVRTMTIGRVAHLTAPTEEQLKLGRGQCQSRNLCMRGCPYGAYFSSQAATLPAATKSGNMTFMPFSGATELIWDSKKGKVTGVRTLDDRTGERKEYFAKVIFLCASALPSAQILMKTAKNGIEIDQSGELGHNVMDHHFHIGALGEIPGYEDLVEYGRRPNGIYVPRYRNFTQKGSSDYLRGFGYQGGAHRKGYSRGVAEDGFGAKYKAEMMQPGGWEMNFLGFGECLPYHSNRVYLHKDKVDQRGEPMLVADCDWGDNELKMRKDMMNDAAEMLEASGAKNIRTYDDGSGFGNGIHEMGTARMGTDRKNSVCDKNNALWSSPNVFLTDGAFMTSAACVNPSLTYMAFTARAANFAAEKLKKGEF